MGGTPMRLAGRISLAATMAALGAAVAPLAAQTFNGTIWFVSGKGGDSKVDTIVQMTNPGLLRMEGFGGGTARGAGAVIVDSKAQTMTVIVPEQKMYITRPFPKLSPDKDTDMNDFSVTETSRTETV